MFVYMFILKLGNLFIVCGSESKANIQLCEYSI